MLASDIAPVFIAGLESRVAQMSDGAFSGIALGVVMLVFAGGATVVLIIKMFVND